MSISKRVAKRYLTARFTSGEDKMWADLLSKWLHKNIESSEQISNMKVRGRKNLSIDYNPPKSTGVYLPVEESDLRFTEPGKKGYTTKELKKWLREHGAS